MAAGDLRRPLLGEQRQLVGEVDTHVWHQHAEADELFIVLKGSLRMDFRDRQVEIGPGEIIVVPKGVEHKPFARRCEMVLFERRGVANTGDGPANERTMAPVRI